LCIWLHTNSKAKGVKTTYWSIVQSTTTRGGGKAKRKFIWRPPIKEKKKVKKVVPENKSLNRRGAIEGGCLESLGGVSLIILKHIFELEKTTQRARVLGILKWSTENSEETPC